ncbi:DUF3536 domain-containing protein [Desulfovulcanus sp.]
MKNLKSLCIHGHLYQPPRFDPWLDEVLPEGSAAPFANWNERITRECYEPLAFARRLNQDGKIFNIINCYECISFNVGPTLLAWMEDKAPQVYARLIEGDKKSVQRFGYGNALAQAYHHIIMPLTTELDRDVEISWAIADFEARFGRRPLGMWLPETGVDIPTLEALARAKIEFTILAPRQAMAVADLDSEEWIPVDETSLDTSMPYLVNLPSGQSIAVFFYNGPLSHGVAFDNYLRDGERFWQKIANGHSGGLLTLATDGESYGHHFKFGEMALAYVIEQALKNREGINLVNLAYYLHQNPPRKKVKIREKTSWSCIHGLKRWQDDCGCSAGSHPGWRQSWRKPLRRALNYLKYYVDEHFRRLGRKLFERPDKALLDYGECLCGKISQEEFGHTYLLPGFSKKDMILAFSLLEMQRFALASFASCAWFFDDIGRIEPLNSLKNALRSMELMYDSGGPDIEEPFVQILEEAFSNDPSVGDGRNIWRNLIKPSQVKRKKWINLGLVLRKNNIRPDFRGVKLLFKEKQMIIIWPKLLKEEKLDLESERDEGGTKELGPNLKKYLLYELARQKQVRMWRGLIRSGEDLVPYLQRWEEGQTEVFDKLKDFLPGLILHYIFFQEIEEDFINYLKMFLSANPFWQQKISSEVENGLWECFYDQNWEQMTMIMERSKKLGLGLDLFKIQNEIWKRGLKEFDSQLLSAFFFDTVSLCFEF